MQADLRRLPVPPPLGAALAAAALAAAALALDTALIAAALARGAVCLRGHS